jgi:hypothetical protein
MEEEIAALSCATEHVRLDLSGHNISQDTAIRIKQAVHDNQYILHVNLEDNPLVDPDTVNEIYRLCTRNRVYDNLTKYLGRKPMEIEKQVVWNEVEASFNGKF